MKSCRRLQSNGQPDEWFHIPPDIQYASAAHIMQSIILKHSKYSEVPFKKLFELELDPAQIVVPHMQQHVINISCEVWQLYTLLLANKCICIHIDPQPGA